MNILAALAERLQAWLACADPLQRADVIFVLAGRRYRKAHGVELLRQGWARRILLSTLNAGSLDLTRFADLHLPAWPRLSELQPRIPRQGRLFFLEYDGEGWRIEPLRVRPFGTLNEIAQLGRWLRRRPKLGSVLVVSSASHLRRVRLCCRRLLPRGVSVWLRAAPPEAPSPSPGWTVILAECAKLALYRIVLAVPVLQWCGAGATDGGARATPPDTVDP